jgi:hypothetical protein
MSPPSEDKVGHGRPPPKTAFKKGQSGNPRRRKTRRPENTVAMIDRLLQSTVMIVINGEPQKVSALEAIVATLLQKAIAGNGRAFTILSKYHEFASKHAEKKIDLQFIDSEYTRSIARSESDDGK